MIESQNISEILRIFYTDIDIPIFPALFWFRVSLVTFPDFEGAAGGFGPSAVSWSAELFQAFFEAKVVQSEQKYDISMTVSMI